MVQNGSSARFRPKQSSFDIIGGIEPHRPHRAAIGRQRDVVTGNHVSPGLDPAAPVAFRAGDADRAVADQIDLAVPLAMARADRATHVEVAAAVTDGDAIERVRIVRAGAMDDVGGVRHRAQDMPGAGGLVMRRFRA